VTSEREVVFRLQFHTGAVQGYSLSFDKEDMEAANKGTSMMWEEGKKNHRSQHVLSIQQPPAPLRSSSKKKNITNTQNTA
jgi:hypothetical protein